MTQTDPNAPFAGQQQEYREEFQVVGDQFTAGRSPGLFFCQSHSKIGEPDIYHLLSLK